MTEERGTGGALQGRVAIVTGSGSGIGRAIAEVFASEGALVVVADIDLRAADATAESIRERGGTSAAYAVDVADSAAVADMVAFARSTFGPVDILVNNAAIREKGNTLLDTDEAMWDRSLAVDLKSAYLCSRAVLPDMLGKGRGAILNISSVNGISAIAGPAYSAAKAGIINLTKNMAIQHGRDGVRVNCIAPGTVKTAIWQNKIASDPGVFERVLNWYPMGRIGEPEDLAKAALFLCSDRAAWISGVTLPVDGGFSARRFRR